MSRTAAIAAGMALAGCGAGAGAPVSHADAERFAAALAARPRPAVHDRAGEVAFVARAGAVSQIWLMELDAAGRGTRLRRLNADPESEVYPTWSPDGAHLLYTRDRDGSAIYLADADGGNARRLSRATMAMDTTPSWSPDGQRIVYAHLLAPPRDGVPPTTELRVMNRDGSGDRLLLAASAFSVEPRWSARGRIAFMSLMRGRTLDIYTIDAAGHGLARLTHAGNNAEPVWSPDGARLVFGSDRAGGGRLNLWTMAADGAHQAPLTRFAPPEEAGDASWSADGRVIAFQHDIGGARQSDPAAPADVWTVAANGAAAVTSGVRCSNVGCSPRLRPRPRAASAGMAASAAEADAAR